MNLEKLNELKIALLSLSAHLPEPDRRKINGDIEELYSWIDSLIEQNHVLEKKGKILAQQVMELNQELENVKSDFGGDQR